MLAKYFIYWQTVLPEWRPYTDIFEFLKTWEVLFKWSSPEKSSREQISGNHKMIKFGVSSEYIYGELKL